MLSSVLPALALRDASCHAARARGGAGARARRVGRGRAGPPRRRARRRFASAREAVRRGRRGREACGRGGRGRVGRRSRNRSPGAHRASQRDGPDEADAAAGGPRRAARAARPGRARGGDRPLPQRQVFPAEPAAGRALRRGLRGGAHAQNGDQRRVDVERADRGDVLRAGEAPHVRGVRRHRGLRGHRDERRLRRPHLRALLHRRQRPGVQPAGDRQGGRHREAQLRARAGPGVLGESRGRERPRRRRSRRGRVGGGCRRVQRRRRRSRPVGRVAASRVPARLAAVADPARLPGGFDGDRYGGPGAARRREPHGGRARRRAEPYPRVSPRARRESRRLRPDAAALGAHAAVRAPGRPARAGVRQTARKAQGARARVRGGETVRRCGVGVGRDGGLAVSRKAGRARDDGRHARRAHRAVRRGAQRRGLPDRRVRC